MGGGAGRVRNVQQVVISALSLNTLLFWPLPASCLQSVP